MRSKKEFKKLVDKLTKHQNVKDPRFVAAFEKYVEILELEEKRKQERFERKQARRNEIHEDYRQQQILKNRIHVSRLGIIGRRRLKKYNIPIDHQGFVDKLAAQSVGAMNPYGYYGID